MVYDFAWNYCTFNFSAWYLLPQFEGHLDAAKKGLEVFEQIDDSGICHMKGPKESIITQALVELLSIENNLEYLVHDYRQRKQEEARKAQKCCIL